MRSLVRLVCILGVASALALVSPVDTSAAPLGDRSTSAPVLDYPTDLPSITVSVVQEGLDTRGRWVQTVRLTIQPGGTLADASLVVFGDVTHVDTLFQAAQRANPHLFSPALIPIGQQIDLRIDPSSVFVLQTVLHGPTALVQRFTNGVVNTIYQTPDHDVTTVLTFPAGKPTDFFILPGPSGQIKVRPGGRIVDLQYARGESFADLVQQAYGVTTYAAAVDLTHQTGWDPTHWPPPTGDAKRVVTDPPGAYATRPTEVSALPNPDPLGRARQDALHQQRFKAGIYAVRLESFGTVYHIAVTDPTVTASALSYLIYGATSHRLDIARAAGYQVPKGESSQATPYDPHLLGRSFDLSVNYQDEDFVASRTVDARGVRHVGLVDGTEIITYPAASHGVLKLVKYPTQYKQIVYRPSKLSLLVAQGLAFFHVATAPNLPSEAAATVARDDTAEVIWWWSPGMPRAPGDIADSVQLVNDPAGTLVDVLVGPPVPRTAVGDTISALRLTNPLIAVAALVVGGAVVVVAVDLARRYRRPVRRRRF